ncbi:unnamed protein product [Blepharisma stoltei]|uniref:MutS-like protein n=1 Tax=Blepharisma stoltei TaxID=1481888 RepID=A0AAU9JFC4_9CILI|nr:unnamed protein product [Blepharisma stoltei]
MNIYSELIKAVEQGTNFEVAAINLKSKIIHLIETTKQEINLLKQQEILLQTACNYYNRLAQNFPDRIGFLQNISLRDMVELRTYARPHPIIIPVVEGISIILNEKEKWVNFCQKLNFNWLPYLMNIDHNALSEQTLQDLGLIVNANRDNISQIYMMSRAAGELFRWLVTTYDWAIIIRDHFTQFSNFKEVDRLVEKDFLEYSSLCAVINSIKNKEKELDLLENIELPRINKILGL